MSTPLKWSDTAIRRLLDTTSCPVCEVDALRDRHCSNCGAEITEQLADRLWQASQTAADALTARQAVLDEVPRALAATRPAPGAVPTPEAAPPASAPQPVDIDTVAAPRSSATVQSVLAVAGAGLFAVAAIVFTFFNPDLTDHVLRSVIVGVITALFLGGAWLLARRQLQFSAEAVGALGMVFVALDVYAISELAGAAAGRWTLAAIGTLAGSSVMVALAARARIRSWLWLSLLGIAIVPTMLGYAGGSVFTALLGHLGTAFAAFGLIEATVAGKRMFDGRLRSERVMLSVLQILAVALVAIGVWFISAGSAVAYWLTVSATLAAITLLACLATRHLARWFWSYLAGVSATLAVVVLPFALDLNASVGFEWNFFAAPAAGAVALIAFGALASRPHTADRPAALGGVLTVAVASVFGTTMLAVMVGAATVLGAIVGEDANAAGLGDIGVFAIVLGLAAMSIGFAAFSSITARRGASTTQVASSAAVAAWLAALAGLALACLPTLPLWAGIAIALGVAVVLSLAPVLVPRIRSAAVRIRLPLVLGAHFGVLLAAILSWTDRPTAIWAGITIVASLVVIARAVPAEIRFLHVGIGYAYALVVFATTLDQLGVGIIAMLCLTTSLGSIGAIVATFLRRVEPPGWYAVLAVTFVPFLIGVVQVVFERSGWTALSTGLIFLLALTLLTTRRAGLGLALRAIAAGILVPSLAVVVVCLGAQVLLGSASPVTLPVIAALVALVLPSTTLIRTALERRGIRAADARAAMVAIEASALLTGAIAVLLALVRVAAGLPTTFTVLVILGLGAAATSFWAERRYGWWVAAAAFTGALWCLWAIAGVDVLEPYLLPPALAAVVIGLTLTARGSRALPLYAVGLITAVTPVLVVLAAFGPGPAASAPWRAFGLIAGAWLLLTLGSALGRGSTERAVRLRALRVPTLGVAILAGTAGAVQGVRFGTGLDPVYGFAVALCFAVALAGALPAAAAARTILSSAPTGTRLARSRWLYAPAALVVAVGTWTAIEREWPVIWSMWALLLAYLVLVVVTAWRLRRGPTSLPPVWFTFAIAFVTAVVAWSPRDLRVEWFSLPLGLFLLAAGAVLLRHRSEVARSVNSWPGGWTGSWALLAPGLVTTMIASVVATFTDPLTWRAILVIVLALVAILIGSSLKLAAPFLIGIIALPIENAFVFLVQIGRGVESMPWWITLAVVGAVLLIIAVTYERRQGEDAGITARLRDLS